MLVAQSVAAAGGTGVFDSGSLGVRPVAALISGLHVVVPTVAEVTETIWKVDSGVSALPFYIEHRDVCGGDDSVEYGRWTNRCPPKEVCGDGGHPQARGNGGMISGCRDR